VDFFGAQEQARRATSWLLFLYALAVACIFAAVYFAVSAGFAFYDAYGAVPPEQASPWLSQERALWTLTITLCVVGFSALNKHATLKRGGAEVCEQLGATRVDVSTRRRLERRLLNVVEEMSIAAGAPVPSVYVLEREQALNAFAAGYQLEDAAIAVTLGLLENLERDELQAVIAHEFSHVLNGDMRLNTRLVAALHGILSLTIFATLLRRAFFEKKKDSDDEPESGSGWRIRASSSSSDSRGGGGGWPLFLAVLVTIVLVTIIGAIGAFFARLIQAAICRQRELLADAQAVQLTRDEEQVRSALRRVEADAVGSLVLSPGASSVAHMFFAEGVSSWLDSHPPLRERIGRLGSATADQPLPKVKDPSGSEAPPPPARLLDVVGSLTRADLAYAVALMRELPSGIRAALEDPPKAEALVYLLLLQEDAAARRAQWRELVSEADPEVIAHVGPLRDELTSIQAQHRLPLLELALPAIQGLGGQERQRFLRNVDRLIESDDKVELFELVVQCMVHFRVNPLPASPTPQPSKRQRRRAARVVLTLLAYLQQGDEQTQADFLRNRSFDAGYDPPLEVEAEAASDPSAVRDALLVLRAAGPKSQRRFLAACEGVMLADGALKLDECELFRAIVIGLGVPMPARAVIGPAR
jgi:Zn-dependent protease with chaperone function